MSTLGWLKSLFKRQDNAISPGLIAAEQKGRDAATSMAAELDEFNSVNSLWRITSGAASLPSKRSLSPEDN